MTTPPPDNQPTHQPGPDAYPQSQQVGAPTPPPPPLPGQAPPPGAFAPSGWEPQRPQGLALAAISLTGAYTLFTIIGAATTQSTIDSTKEALANGDTSANPAGSLVQLVSFAVGVAAFVVLALWMTRIRSNLAARGVKAGGPPAVEWWGWFVPLANYVLPFLGMKAIARNKASIGALLGWWIPFCLTWIASVAATFVSITAIDYETGDLTSPDALDVTVPITYFSTIMLVVSWAFLFTIIRRVTARHLED
jgi:hypothetical protein